jgi:predicted CoA-binding protein
MKTIVVLGASDKSERLSNTAVKLLVAGGYDVVPVNPNLVVLEGVPVFHTLRDVKPTPDVLTMYVNQGRSTAMADDILALSPKVVIFNPGAENEMLEKRLTEQGAKVIRACTVVLLKTGRFEEATT